MNSVCKFCGQAHLPDREMSAEELEAFAIAECDCPDARQWQRRKEQIASAKVEIGALLGEEYTDAGFIPVTPAVKELFKELCEFVGNEDIKSVKVQLTGKASVMMQLNGKGEFAIVRSESKHARATV